MEPALAVAVEKSYHLIDRVDQKGHNISQYPVAEEGIVVTHDMTLESVEALAYYAPFHYDLYSWIYFTL